MLTASWLVLEAVARVFVLVPFALDPTFNLALVQAVRIAVVLTMLRVGELAVVATSEPYRTGPLIILGCFTKTTPGGRVVTGTLEGGFIPR